MAIERILVIDDEEIVREFLSEFLKRKNMDVTAAASGAEALRILKEQTFDMVITDMKMPDITGIDVLKKTKELSPETLVVVITAHGSIENAVEAMRLGAFHYLIKPFSPDAIETIIEKAQEMVSLVNENSYLRQQQMGDLNGKGISQIIGESPAIKRIIQDIERIAQSNAAVFITGESGTGKEVIAQAIHYHSNRANRPFIKVNCAAVPDTLIESEFFGHEKGSFTGANARRLGRFELAHGGTLLLDEVTETPPALQAKLLRVIQEQEFERVGGVKPVKVDVRLISTSNRNMREAIAQKVLREDLYYRLNVVPLYLPPLRERKEDILPLANHFLQKMCIENHKDLITLSKAAENKLVSYSWPGNVRELANIIERAVVMNTGNQIQPEHLYIERVEANSSQEEERVTSGLTLKEIEKRLILDTLRQHDNNRTKTAEILGISVRTLRNKLHEYNVS